MEELMNTQPPRPSFESSSNDGECNICYDVAQDPIFTLCGHLFCWPCLYDWIHIHSQCPVCEALIEEEKLVPPNETDSLSGRLHALFHHGCQQQQVDSSLKLLFLLIGVAWLSTLIWL